MKLIISTPEQLRTKRAALLQEAVELMRRQARSSSRYSRLVNRILSKIEAIDKQIS